MPSTPKNRCTHRLRTTLNQVSTHTQKTKKKNIFGRIKSTLKKLKNKFKNKFTPSK